MKMKLLMESFKKFLKESAEIQLPTKETYYMQEAEKELVPDDYDDDNYRTLWGHILSMKTIWDEERQELNQKYGKLFDVPAPHLNDAYEEKFIEYVNMAKMIKKIPLVKVSYDDKMKLIERLLANIEESVKADAEVSPYSPRGASILGLKFVNRSDVGGDHFDPEENPYLNPNHALKMKLQDKSVFIQIDSKAEKYIMQIKDIASEIEEEKNQLIRDKYVSRLTSIIELTNRFLSSYDRNNTISQLIDDHEELGFFLSETIERRWQSMFKWDNDDEEEPSDPFGMYGDLAIIRKMREEWEQDSYYSERYDYKSFIFDRYGELVQKMMTVGTAMSILEVALKTGFTENFDVDQYIEKLKEVVN